MVRSNYGTSTSHFSKGLEPIQKICSVGKGASMVEARVENKSFFALMDSGAAVSLVNSDFASENRLIWKEKVPDKPYWSAGSNPIEILGEAQIQVEIGNMKIKESFLVSKNLAQRMIIGGDILRKHKVDIMFSKGCVKIGDQEVPMKSNRTRGVEMVDRQVKPSEIVNIDEDNLEPTEVRRLKEVLDKYPEVFSKDNEDIGQSDFIHRIELTDYTPLNSRAYRVPHAQKPMMEEEVIKMLRMGVIQRVNSDWSSPVVLVKKKDDSIRFCTDFRKLNAVTIKDNYPMPFIEEKLESFGGKKYFSSLDMTSGYWQFLVDPSARRLTTFVCHMGAYEYIRMPFGLCNAGATFQRAMEGVLDGLTCASAYIDDVMTASESFEQHLVDLESVFKRLKDAKLKIKPKKCTFGYQETKFLGFIISRDGIKVCPSREACIRNYPTPKTPKNVRQFLGLASYYRKFIKDFATIANPLSLLTHKKAKFVWTESSEKAFRQLIKMLLSPPILVFPNHKLRFRLATDASNCGLGAVLSQISENDDEQVIAYASRTLNAAEKNYSTTEQELLAIIWACEKFRPYLFGVEFDLLTDHKPLTYLSALNLSSSRLIRWKMRLQEYSFKLIHKPGKEHVNADVLSRMYEDDIVAMIKEEEQIDDDFMIRMQDSDEGIRRTISMVKQNGGAINNYQLFNGILFCVKKDVKFYEPQRQYRPVIPRCLIGQIMTLCHDDIPGSHLGKNKTWSKVASRYFWEGMKEDVMEWVESCSDCARRKDPPPSKATLGSIVDPVVPFDKIGIDFLGPLTTTNGGNKYILVVTDYATRWVEAFATSDQKATTVARILIDEIISRHGAPKAILSDQGRQFLSDLVKEVCKYFDIKKMNTTSYHPQCNGLTERFNATMCQMLSMYIDTDQENWDIFLPMVLFAYRTSTQKTTRETPFRLMYGRDARLPSDLEKWSPQAHFVGQLDQAWKLANQSIIKQAEKSQRWLKSKVKETKPFEVDDRVRLHCPATKIGLKRKLRSDLWQGPFVIEKVRYPNVTIADKTYHMNRIKRAEPTRSRYGRRYKRVERLGIIE